MAGLGTVAIVGAGSVGSGTVLDASRLRYLLAERSGIAATSAHAHVVGEHGDTSLPVAVGRAGVVRRLPVTLDADERTALGVGALAVRRSYESL